MSDYFSFFVTTKCLIFACVLCICAALRDVSVQSLQQEPLAVAGTEGYFDGTAFAILKSSLDIRHMTSLGFRTCSQGLLFHQAGAGGDSLKLELTSDGRLRLQWRVTGTDGFVDIGQNLNDNRWHQILMRYALGVINFTVDNTETVVANSTWHSELLRLDLKSPNPEVVIGQGFQGCLLQGASLVFNDPSIHSVGVNWTLCPLPNRGHCDGYRVDYCFSQPCHKHGTCTSSQEGYQCHCTMRYTGRNCETDTGPLCERPELSRCQNGGVCQEDKTGNFTSCACPPKYTGPSCEHLIDDRLCDTNPCRNNATCHLNRFGDGYECACLSGFAGTDCETNIDECSSSPCQHSGVCIDGIDAYICQCQETGYRGQYCEVNIDECAEDDPCFNGGRCFDTYGGYFCECPLGFTGRNCEKEVNECSSAPCKHGATCQNLLNRYQCICPSGFQGTNCEVNIDDCVGVTCPGTAHCIDGIDTFQCVCNSGYSGVPPNCTDIDECATEPCLNGGTCLDHLGEFRCVCPIGFVGLNCEREVDECASSPCLSGGTCIDGVGSYTCLCPAGLLGPNCSKDVDECISLPCLHGGRCEDKVGHFECHCTGGWSGKNCEFDIDECDASPCQHDGRCEDEVGDYTCHCRRSWSGRNCEISLDPCAAGPCLNNGTCTNKADGNFTCTCSAGFTGIHCETNQDECLSHPCVNGGTCEDRANGFHCHCPDEFVGPTCSDSFDDCIVNPCRHGGTCHSLPPNRRNSTCSCPAGFLGDRCEIDEDNCREAPVCPAGHVCRDLPDGFECQCPVGFEGRNCEVDIDECSDMRCLNGGTCVDGVGNATCVCVAGFHGARCELDIDECANNETYPCFNGMCQNTMGSFQCWCKPGYTGVYCDREYNECLPQPCQNGGTCRDLVAKYKCLCPLGFTGQNCSTDIDECASQPCLNNGTCSDGVGAFVCQCQPGYAGIVCEQDIDECSSSPCQNAGVCMDQVNGFLCDCSDTGFFGDFCQENIDDCASSPCIHDSNCTDLVKNYSCSCHAGFNGHNCELDIAECVLHPCHNGGECVERSNRSVYEMDDELRPLGFPLGPYSHSKAGGYLCICPSGFTGSDCEINIDDCADAPCRNGTCVDGINEYGCECFRGFEGSHCETEIDECRRYRPCLRSTCIDKIGDYECQCEPGIGGKNCTVQLTGCAQNDCQNGATCVPYLIGEDRHVRNCSCPNGFYGTTCQHSTTMSFAGKTEWLQVMGNTSLDYHLSLRFRTTLPDGLLAFGHGGHVYLLFLREGALRFVIERNNQSLITLGHGINNGEWWTVRLNFFQWGVHLYVGNSKLHWETNVTVDFHGPIPAMPSTYIGGKETWMKPEMDFHIAYIPNFVGCMEDVTLSGGRVVPNVDTRVSGITTTGSVITGCHRTEQCFPSTCNGGGTCVDYWNEYSCSCSRPHYGLHCEHEYDAATFGHENASQSLVEADIGLGEQLQLKNNATVSLFARTRQSDGLIFYLGNGNSLDGAGDEDTFLAAEWESGVLRVSVKINGTPESLVDKMGRRLNDGYYQFLEVSLVNRTLSASINKTTIFKMDVEANKDRYLEANHLYLGGLPPPQVLHFPPPSDPTTATHEAPLLPLTRVARAPYFKGVMQDVRLNDWMVDIFNTDAALPLEVTPRILQGNITKINVLRGVQSDNACSSNPCQNGSNCTVTWNDYHCECKKGFRGKNCTDREFCAFNSCPLQSECHSLSDGYECISNATFNGVNSSIAYIPHLKPEVQLNSISFYYRSERGGSLLHMARGRHFFDVVLTASGDLRVSWNLNEGSSDNRSIVRIPVDSEWHFVHMALAAGEITIQVDGGEPDAAGITSVGTLDQLTRDDGTEPQFQLLVGGTEEAGYYRGCLREMRLGDILLPFFPRAELSNDTSPSYFEAVTVENIKADTCLLCFESECQHGSVCLDQHNHFECNCSKGYEGQLCEVNIDECQGITCENGGTCLDGVNAFTCECIPGYEGKICEHEINECIDGPCMHGGTCIDQLNSYSCACLANYTGTNCEKEKPFDCSSHPCVEGSTCVDVPSNIHTEARYECHCPVGRTGTTCDEDIDYCQVNPCQNGGLCSNKPRLGSYNCTCSKGFEGQDCELATNFCKSNPCLNEGRCHSMVEDFNCTCVEGFQGKSCELDINECLKDNVCEHNGNCINEIGTFHCNCAPPYTGQICNSTNPCLIINDTCHNGGSCHPNYVNDTEMGITCECTSEYDGDFCEHKIESNALDAEMLGIVIGSVVAATVLIVAGVLTVFLTMAKKKRATRGTYSPSRQEMFGSRVEMGHVMKPPPEERLI